jgi:hypothetical protein
MRRPFHQEATKRGFYCEVKDKVREIEMHSRPHPSALLVLLR